MDYLSQSLYMAEQANRLSALQVHVLADIRGSLRSMAGELQAVRQAQLEGIALQQAALQREIFQDKVEEFVYQLHKAVTAFATPKSVYPPSTQYFFLRGVFESVEREGIATAVIRGRDNKLAFEAGLDKARLLYRQLERHPEVREALAWAEREQKKRAAAARSIKGKIEHLRQSRPKADFVGWYKQKFAWVDENPDTRHVVHVLLWIFGGFFWIPIWFMISAKVEESQVSAVIDAQIRDLELRLHAYEGEASAHSISPTFSPPMPGPAQISVLPASAAIGGKSAATTPSSTGATPAHENPLVIAGSLFLCWPVGLILLWLHPRVAKEIKWGVAAACGLFMICGLASLAINDRRREARGTDGRSVSTRPSRAQKDVLVEGDLVKIRITIHHGAPFIDNLKTRAFEIAQRVYEVAAANPAAKRAEVTLVMNKQGVQDEFGRAWAEDREMGSFEVGNLDEVRKYVDGPNYGVSDRVSATYQAKIKQLKYANLLTE